MTIIQALGGGGGGGGGLSSFMYGPNFALNAESDHFDSATLDPKWTVVANTMGGGYDVHTTVKSALVVKPTATGQSIVLTETVSHTGDVSYVVMLSGAPNTNFTDFSLGLWNSSSRTDGVTADWKYSSGQKLACSHKTAGTWTFDVFSYAPVLTTACSILLQRKGTTWKMGFGHHPYTLFPIGGSLTKSIGTINTVSLEMNSSGNVTPWIVDCILRDYISVP